MRDGEATIRQLDAPERETRLGALRELKRMLDGGELQPSKTGRDVNNHIHTAYSFSPYYPAGAVWFSCRAGLCTAGIVDHDSVGGVREFLAAGEILDFPITTGFELRVSHERTAMGGRRTNNPDQNGVSYLTFHGLPRTRIDAVAEFLAPVCAARGQRNRAMCQNIARLTDFALDYDHDVLPLSMAREGGSVTERHLLYALAQKLMERYGRGGDLLRCLAGWMPVSEKARVQLTDPNNPYYAYDLLGLLKAQLVEQFYIPAGGEECPDIEAAVEFARENGIIATYPYLGDVGDSVTGDKKAQEFEDGYLDELFEILYGLGLRAISYMPSRNTREQLLRLRALCDDYQMLQISGEDINSPRQSFICMAQRDPVYANLFDTAWALIGHEIAAAECLGNSFAQLELPLDEKLTYFCERSAPLRRKILGGTS